jgi:hypothetical protein
MIVTNSSNSCCPAKTIYEEEQIIKSIYVIQYTHIYLSSTWIICFEAKR